MPMTEDLAGFLAESEFAHVAILNDTDQIRGIFELAYEETDFGLRRVGGAKPRFTCSATDAESLVDGDRLTIERAAYRVLLPLEPDGTGLTTIRLELID